jgi:spore germination protein GerM
MHQKGVKQVEEVGQKQILGEEGLLIGAPILRHITP